MTSGRSRSMEKEGDVRVVSHQWRSTNDFHLAWRCARCKSVTTNRDEAPACGVA